MGVDIPDIRCILHIGHTRTLLDYAQKSASDVSGLTWLAVSTSTAALLRVVEQGPSVSDVEDTSDVGNVHAHSQGTGGHNDRRLADSPLIKSLTIFSLLTAFP
ncbi:hypothetical protein N7461_004222 [Penicillium sp. DV-2018c]|nr:hypothetical protein N7461_004222 [Penicillium sp. DV-2018c]